MFFGIGVIAPLALRLTAQSDRNGQFPKIYRVATWFHPVVTLAVGASLLLPPGGLAGLFASLWLIQTCLFAVYGLTRLLPRTVVAVEELCLDMSLLYVPISGLWFLAYCAGYPLLTFDPAFVLLTAVHFVFISLGALVIGGRVGQQLYDSSGWKMYRIVAWLMLIGPLFVAIGISSTQFTGKLVVESLTVWMFTGSFILFALLSLFRGLPQLFVARILILLSSATLVITMCLAAAYPLGRLTGWWSLSLTQMVEWHGWLNAVGFTFLGLLGWNLAPPISHTAPPGIPFSRLSTHWQVGPNFFSHNSIIDTKKSVLPTGIVDHLSDYQRPDFNPQDIAPIVTAFYENTAAHELLVYPQWQPGFQLLARGYKQISQRIGQMNFPIRADTEESRISSTIVPLNDSVDGRENVRGWIRVYVDTGSAVYVAAYSSHIAQNQRYMNIAFPLPFGNLTSILRLEHLKDNKDNEKGLLLTSYSTRYGDQGVYFANRLLPIRLPINETIKVYTGESVYAGYPSGFAIGEVIAEHKMWIFGIHCLTLHYSIRATASFQ